MEDDITIAVNGVSVPILCGKCRMPVSFVGEADPENGRAGCMPCDNIAGVKEVGQLAVEYAKDEAQLALNRAARDVARDSKFMTFKGTTEHTRPHPFVVDLAPIL